MITHGKVLGITIAGLVLIWLAGNESPYAAAESSRTEPSRLEEIRSQIGTLPYLSGYKSIPSRTGVTLYDKSHACEGLNLCISGGSPPVVLMDMDGNVLHKWMNKLQSPNPKKTIFRRVHLFPDGDILAILEGKGLLKLDKDSNTIWFLRGQYHHDLDIAENGDIYVLTRRDVKIDLPELDLNGQFTKDYITILSTKGKEKKNISLLKCFLNSDYSSLLFNIRLDEHHGDNFHTNTLELISGSASESFQPFKKGHALISLRNLHIIALIDLAREKVVWALSGMWTHQHQPTLLDNGNILLFDNMGYEGRSKVIEFNPSTHNIVWAYRGDADNGFYTEDMGSQQRLDNGNTLITESRDGRVFEVTPDNKIVWEFFNPLRSVADNNLIGTIFDMIRLDPEKISFLEQRD